MKNVKTFFMKLKSILFRKKNIKWFLLIIIIFIVLLFFIFNKKVKEYKIENHEVYQYFMGFKMEYKGSIKLNKDNHEITKITFGDDSVNLNSTPLYYKDEKKVLFPESMSVIRPSDGTQYRISYYSIFYRDLDYYSVKNGEKNQKITNSVIYDGNDLYFFVENVVVSFGQRNIELGPFSYIVVDTFNHSLEVYDYKDDKSEVYSDITDEVTIKGNKYKINATYDVMYYNDKSRLLIKDISKLKALF